MSQSIKVSFVIPAYNVGDYIQRSLSSILEQGFPDIEILIVDDGSTDHTVEACEAFIAAHSEAAIRLYKQKNAGVSAARNRGLREALGEYICFLDADDFYIEPFLERFYRLCKENQLDIIRGIYSIYDEDVNVYKHVNRKNLSYADKVLSGQEFLVHSIRENANEVVPWLGLFRREFLIENGFLFPEGIAFEEDQLFFLECLLHKDTRIMQVLDDFYAYMVRKGSASKSPSLSRAYDALKITQAEVLLVQRMSLSKAVRKSALCYAGSSFYQLTSVYGRVSKEDRSTLRRYMKGKKRLLYCRYAGTSHQKIKNFLFQYFPRFVALVYDFRSKK